MELRQLRALLAVVDTGTFTDAAIGLELSQASVSRAVAGLEAALGVRLLDRTTRSVTTTAAGARVVVHARRVVAEADALVRAATDDGGVLRVGYAWSALGRHTTEVLRKWAARHPATHLDLVQANTPTSGLVEGLTDLAVLRTPVLDPRFATELIGVESRYAAVASDDPWARRRFVRLADFAGRTVAVDAATSTTTEDLWEASAGVRTLPIRGMEEWLNVIGSGQAVGMSAEATVALHPRPGVVYKRVRDAPPIPVTLSWWRDDPPPMRAAFLALAREQYAT